jgi:hypothetical protein
MASPLSNAVGTQDPLADTTAERHPSGSLGRACMHFDQDAVLPHSPTYVEADDARVCLGQEAQQAGGALPVLAGPELAVLGRGGIRLPALDSLAGADSPSWLCSLSHSTRSFDFFSSPLLLASPAYPYRTWVLRKIEVGGVADPDGIGEMLTDDNGFSLPSLPLGYCTREALPTASPPLRHGPGPRGGGLAGFFGNLTCGGNPCPAGIQKDTGWGARSLLTSTALALAAWASSTGDSVGPAPACLRYASTSE